MTISAFTWLPYPEFSDEELDALVAYLQILGKLTDAAHKHAAGG